LIPGEGTAIVVGRLGASAVGGALAAWHGDVRGVGLAYADMNAELFGPNAGGSGIQIAKALPIMGQGISLLSLGRDIHHISRELLDCGQ
jgi:hypothetical protein